jgi:hypothetical protein
MTARSRLPQLPSLNFECGFVDDGIGEFFEGAHGSWLRRYK